MALITVNETACKGCGLCVEACPKGLLRISKEKINNKGYRVCEMTDMSKCVGCTSCALTCPDLCIEVER